MDLCYVEYFEIPSELDLPVKQCFLMMEIVADVR
jgi:hypothetical protein